MKTLIAAAVLVAATAATAKDHVGFVNIAGAVEKGLLADVVTNGVLNVVQVRTAVYEEPDINVAHIVGLASMGYPKGERKISVYFVNTKDLPPQVTVPGFLAVINVRGLERDADAKTYAMRIKKMALKGLAFACGFGATPDAGRCVMGTGSFDTLKGIDATSASYSPFCYFPLNDYLQRRGLLIDDPVEF